MPYGSKKDFQLDVDKLTVYSAWRVYINVTFEFILHIDSVAP